MLYAFICFNSAFNFFFSLYASADGEGLYALIPAVLSTKKGSFEEPKDKGLTEAFCFSSAIQNIFKQGISENCYLLLLSGLKM